MAVNPYLQKFNQELDKRYSKDSAAMTHGQWMCKNTTLNKKPFNFTRYPFQEAIANDMSDNLDCIKPSQVGLTEIQIRKVLSILARTENISVIYTLPNDKMFKRISKGRIKPIIDTDRAFKSLHGNKNSMDLIQIGSSFLYVTGSTEGDATSINADMIFNDEVDLTDQQMLALFNSRLQGSDLRIKQRFSTPTYNGYGIHKGYSASDQHEYMIKCRACNNWQIPLFNKVFVPIPHLHDKVNEWTDLEPKMLDSGLIDLNTLKVCCEKCRRPLNLADYDNRQWVARYPNRVHHRGYHVRPFSTHTLDPKYIMSQLLDYKRRSNMKGFFNTVLGETYNVGNNRLDASQIENVMVSASPIDIGNTPVFIGIDVGAVCHITIGAGNCENMTIIGFETCMEDQLDLRIGGIRKRLKLLSGGIDKYPYTPLSNAIRDATGGLIMPVEYGQGREFSPILDEFKVQSGIRASRTVLLDTVAAGIRNGTWQFSGYGEEKETIITHLQDMVREEGTGEEEPRWVKLNGNDHYFHSLAFLVAAARNYEFQLHSGDYEHTDDDVVMSDLQDNGLEVFGANDLVGFSTKQRNSKIITRYT